jgi:hypothetical protein
MYEAILLGLQVLSSMGVKHVEAFGDSLLVVQQIVGTFQCLDGSLNAYLDKWLKIIALFNDFTMHHVSRDENTVANDLAQQASGSQANRGKFGFWKNRMFCFAKSNSLVFSYCTVQESVMLNQIQQNQIVRFLKPEGPEFPGLQAKQAKQRRPVLMIGGHPWYVI